MVPASAPVAVMPQRRSSHTYRACVENSTKHATHASKGTGATDSNDACHNLQARTARGGAKGSCDFHGASADAAVGG